MKSENVLVCLPVLNEDKAIQAMISQLKALPFSIIISDGGSSDNSLHHAERENIPVLHRPGKSKGIGMLQAIRYAKENNKAYVVFIDCDLTYPVDKIIQMVSLIQSENLDMVVGSRNQVSMTRRSRFLNFLLAKFVCFLFGGDLKDPGSGFRVIRTESYFGKLQETGMDLEIELSGFSLKKNLKVKEIDVDYFARVGESKLRLIDIIHALFTIFRVRFRRYT